MACLHHCIRIEPLTTGIRLKQEGKVDKGTLIQFGRAMRQLSIEIHVL